MKKLLILLLLPSICIAQLPNRKVTITYQDGSKDSFNLPQNPTIEFRCGVPKITIAMINYNDSICSHDYHSIEYRCIPFSMSAFAKEMIRIKHECYMDSLLRTIVDPKKPKVYGYFRNKDRT